jgi:CRISPR-associated protein Csx10
MLLSILCVSDVLLRDERLAPDPSPARLGAVLGAALGVVLSILPDPTGGSADTEPEGGLFRHTAVTTVRREGFVRRWGRPRGTLVALGAGSVVTFRSDSAPQPQAVARVERDGIGERVAEGFGRVLVNPAELSVARPTVLSDGDLGTSTADSQDRAIGTMSTRSPTPSQWAGSAHPIELNAWRNEIRRRAMQAALQPEDVLPGIRKPSRAQLGALRGQLKRLSLPNGQALVREWFDAQQVRHHRLNWGSDTLVRAKSLLLDAPDEVWSRLRLDGAQPALVLAEGREPLLRTALQTEAVTVLVVEVLRVVRDSRIDRGASTNHGPLTNQLGQE